MKGSFVAPGKALAAAVHYTAHWLDPRPAHPAQGGLLLDVAGGILTLTGFNESATARARLPVEGDATGRTIVAGRLVDRIIGTFPATPVTVSQDGSVLGITAGKFRSTMPSMSERDYPARPGEAPIAGSVDGATLADAVHRVRVAASSDVSNSATVYRAGIHVAFTMDLLILTATDGYRVARTSIPWEPADEGFAAGNSALVLASVLGDSSEVFADGTVRLGWATGSLTLTSPDRALVVSELGVTHLAAGDSLPFRAVDTQQAVALVETAATAPPLKRVEILNDGASDKVWLDFRRGSLDFRADSESGQGGEPIDIDYDGPDFSMQLKIPFLKAAFDSTPGGVARVGFTPTALCKAIVVTAPADPAWIHILALIRRA